MKITNETARRADPNTLQIRVDPHDDACHGAHDVVVVAIPATFTMDDGKFKPVTYHCTLTWQASAFLSVRGSREFAEAIEVACGIAEQIMKDGEYRE